MAQSDFRREIDCRRAGSQNPVGWTAQSQLGTLHMADFLIDGFAHGRDQGSGESRVSSCGILGDMELHERQGPPRGAALLHLDYLGGRDALLREVHLVQQRLEARLRAEGVENRAYF